jgi:hypothetical protein
MLKITHTIAYIIAQRNLALVQIAIISDLSAVLRMLCNAIHRVGPSQSKGQLGIQSCWLNGYIRGVYPESHTTIYHLSSSYCEEKLVMMLTDAER